MGILQTAYLTYERQLDKIGLVEEKKESLVPVSHAMVNAHIEIVLSIDGAFQSAAPIAKAENKTIIPVTIDSANSRTSDNTKAHSLCDQLRYLAAYGGDKFAVYLAQLTAWANSSFVHPKVAAVLAYIQGGSIVSDLAAAGVITLDEQGVPSNGKIEGNEYSKCLVRWRILPAPDGIRSACWEDNTLFDCYCAFYADQCAGMERDLCYVSGEEDMVCEMHPKGIIPAKYGAKLVSSNDSSGFTYRGRFTQSRQAYSFGYTASQKAHLALRWIAANHGIIIGGKTFLCWSPGGADVPTESLFGFSAPEPIDFVSYKRQLWQALSGYTNALKDTDDVVIAALDVATTGRLSVTYYNELKASDFLARVEDWYSTICWETRYGVQAPSLRRIVDCAFGTERSTFIEADDRVRREHVQRLLHCIVDKQPVPFDIVQALVTKACKPLAYKSGNREIQLSTTCSLVRKYHNSKHNKEEWTLALDTSNSDRSYLFGRLLAVAERVERSTYGHTEGREPNAIRMQSIFAQRPLYAWRILEEKLVPYYARLQPGLRNCFKNIIGEITDKIFGADSPDLGKKLSDVYLLDYYHQRSAMTTKKEASMKEEKEYESTEE